MVCFGGISVSQTHLVFFGGKDERKLENVIRLFNSLPNDKISDVTKIIAFADDKLNVARMISTLDSVENAAAKEENAGYQHFPLFLQCFPKPSSLGSLKVGIVW